MSSSYPPLPPSPKDVKPTVTKYAQTAIASTPATVAPPSKKMKFTTHIVRQDEEVSNARPLATREQRLKMNEKDLINLIEKITTGFEKKLSKVDYDKMMSKSNKEDLFQANEGM